MLTQLYFYRTLFSMATNTKSAPKLIRVAFGLLPDDVKQIKRLKTRLSSQLDGKVTTARIIRLALTKLESTSV
jgi:hypothetical protein